MSTHKRFLWRNKQSYPLIIFKYAPCLHIDSSGKTAYVLIFHVDRNFLLRDLKPLFGVKSSFLEALNKIVFL